MVFMSPPGPDPKSSISRRPKGLVHKGHVRIRFRISRERSPGDRKAATRGPGVHPWSGVSSSEYISGQHAMASWGKRLSRREGEQRWNAQSGTFEPRKDTWVSSELTCVTCAGARVIPCLHIRHHPNSVCLVTDHELRPEDVVTVRTEGRRDRGSGSKGPPGSCSGRGRWSAGNALSTWQGEDAGLEERGGGGLPDVRYFHRTPGRSSSATAWSGSAPSAMST